MSDCGSMGNRFQFEESYSLQSEVTRACFLLEPLMSAKDVSVSDREMRLRLVNAELKRDDGQDVCNTALMSARLTREYLMDGVVNCEAFVSEAFGDPEWASYFSDVSAMLSDLQGHWNPTLPFSTHTLAGYFGVDAAPGACPRRELKIERLFTRKPRPTRTVSVAQPSKSLTGKESPVPPAISAPGTSPNAAAEHVTTPQINPSRSFPVEGHLIGSVKPKEMSNDEDLVTDGTLAFVFGASGFSLVKQNISKAAAPKEILPPSKNSDKGRKKPPAKESVLSAAKVIAVEAKPATPPPLSMLVPAVQHEPVRHKSRVDVTAEELRELVDQLPLHARAAALIGFE